MVGVAGTPSVSLLLLALMVASCGPAANRAESDNPVRIAEDYAREHYLPNHVPQGMSRAWHIEDHGDIWTVELGEQGGVGGGIKVAIRKSDGKVLGSELTQ